MERILAQHAHGVSTGKHTKRTIFQKRIIEMQAECYDAREGTRWGVRVDHSVFHRPRSPLRNLTPFAQGQRRVLMPNDKPIGRKRFVKECRSERERIASKNLLGDPKQPAVAGNFEDSWVLKCVPHTCATSA